MDNQAFINQQLAPREADLFEIAKQNSVKNRRESFLADVLPELSRLGFSKNTELETYSMKTIFNFHDSCYSINTENNSEIKSIVVFFYEDHTSIVLVTQEFLNDPHYIEPISFQMAYRVDQARSLIALFLILDSSLKEKYYDKSC